MKKLLILTTLFSFLFTAKNSYACDVNVSNIVNVSCNGICDGSAQATASNGTAPYTYALSPNGTIDANTGAMSNLCAGVFTVTVTDAVLCVTTTIITITQPTAISLNLSNATSPSCNPGCDGTVQAVASGGTLPYTYTISPLALINANTGFANGLCATPYTITVTDVNNCTSTNTITLPAPPAISFSVATITNPSCNPGCDGIVTTTLVGGSPPYSFAIGGGAFINLQGVASNLCSGLYTITAIDGNGCTGTTTAWLIGPNAPVASVTNITNIFCFGSCTGSAQAGSTGGVPPIVYSITPPGFIDPVTGVIPAILCAGTYTVIATDANGCSGTSVFTLTQPPLLSLNINIVEPNCNGACDGSITPAAIGGTPPYVYTITGNNYNNLCAGSYTVTVTDANNCQTATTIVNLMPAAYNNNIYPAAVAGAGSITATPTGGTAPYQFSLNGGPFTANNTFSMLCTGAYTLTVKDNFGAGCLKDTLVTVLNTAPAFPGGSIIPFLVNPTCALSPNGMITLATTPVNNYQYQWSNGGNSYFINNLTEDTYSVTITNPAGECVQNSYTLTAIGNNCGNITGTVYYDSMQNCMQDVSEPGIPNTMLIANPGNHITFTDALGGFTYNGLPYGNYTLTHQNNLSGHYTHCGNNLTAVINNLNPNQVVEFGDSSSTSIDYLVYLWNPGCFVIANPSKMKKITYRHNNPQYGNSTGTVYAVMDSIAHYQFATPAPSNISGDTLFWNVNIGYFNQFIDLYCVFPNNYTVANTFPLKIGIMSTQFADTFQLNNVQNLIIPFCNAYDPNNKIVTPKGEGQEGNLDINDSGTKLITYYINFQNTGNAPAYNIVIEDTLSDKLDLSTFHVLSTSHPHQLEVINNQVIKWKFYNIMLPDSNANEPASHGQIIYQIRQNNTNIVGDEIKNTAYIYFDYNPAIITNETVNTIVMPNTVNDIYTESEITIYPNPASDLVYIESEKEFTEITVYGMQMNKLKTITIAKNKKAALNTKMLSDGMYFIRTNNGQIRKLIIQK